MRPAENQYSLTTVTKISIQHEFNTRRFYAKRKNRKIVMIKRFFVGGDEGDRTPYLLNAIVCLHLRPFYTVQTLTEMAAKR